jgi:hypothetical protein
MTNKQGSGNPDNSGSSADFFDKLEAQVNGAILDEQTDDNQATFQDNGPQEVTHNEPANPDNTQTVDWEKRYKDSSREATRMRGELQQLKPYVPLLDVMRKDQGLVQHVRGYLEGGGKPAQNIKERLGLDKDFIYDPDEAMNDPESDSAKVLDAHVDGLVQNKLKTELGKREQQAKQQTAIRSKAKEAMEFAQSHNMTREQFQQFFETAKSRGVSLEDMYYLVNKDQANQNVANSTKNDMLNQMKNVRSMPTSAGGVNSPRAEKSQDDQIFDALADSSVDFDELFG